MLAARSGKSANELVEEMRPYVDSIAADYPSYVKWWSENKIMDVDKLQVDSFDFGLEHLLDGLEIWLNRP